MPGPLASALTESPIEHLICYENLQIPRPAYHPLRVIQTSVPARFRLALLPGGLNLTPTIAGPTMFFACSVLFYPNYKAAPTDTTPA
jgi:hypothetical protein